MELFIAIALLCQTNSTMNTRQDFLSCQQSYVHCFNVKVINGRNPDREALGQCILEKK
jgi:hypothetical protein